MKMSFAERLQTLIHQANIKIAQAADAAGYDISYISKWIGGKALPSEKAADHVLSALSECLEKNGNRQKLRELYGCEDKELLTEIREDLEKAYWDSKSTSESGKMGTMEPLSQAVTDISKVLYNSRKITAAVDLFSMRHEERMLLSGMKNGHFAHGEEDREYSLVIDVGSSSDCVYDSIFMIHMLTSLSGFDFSLYNHKSAFEKLVCICDGSVTAGMMFQDSILMISQTADTDGKIADEIRSLMGQERMVFRKIDTDEFIRHEYVRTMVAVGTKWILGHAMEMLIPEDVFEELVTAFPEQQEMRRLYRMSQAILTRPDMRVIVYESVFSDLLVTGELDFFNHKVLLNTDQIVRCMDYYLKLSEMKGFRMLSGWLSDDFRYITNPCLFLSESVSCLRLENKRYKDNLLVLEDREVKQMMEQFYEKIWNERTDIIHSSKETLREKMLHYRETAERMNQLESN